MSRGFIEFPYSRAAPLASRRSCPGPRRTGCVARHHRSMRRRSRLPHARLSCSSLPQEPLDGKPATESRAGETSVIPASGWRLRGCEHDPTEHRLPTAPARPQRAGYVQARCHVAPSGSLVAEPDALACTCTPPAGTRSSRQTAPGPYPTPEVSRSSPTCRMAVRCSGSPGAIPARSLGPLPHQTAEDPVDLALTQDGQPTAPTAVAMARIPTAMSPHRLCCRAGRRPRPQASA